VRGPGYGGTVRRATIQSPGERTVSVVVRPGVDAAATIAASIQNELDLYAPMKTVIENEWAQDHRAEPLAVEVTALQGSKLTGGTWSRPDIVSIEVRTFAFIPGKHLEVVSFEVKAAHSINVQAVYEALAHRRSATRSYVLLHVPDPADYETWDERVEADRVVPDPERLDTFIAVQLNEKTRMKIVRAVK
jgi:hypothetical protein